MIAKRRWPWVAQQSWQDILFIHTPVTYEKLRKLVPRPFEPDTYDGKGWISLVLFEAADSRLRYMPKFLSYPSFNQMNVRSYVKFGDEPGVYFFSINTNRLLVTLGGDLASLPFSKANIVSYQEKDLLYFSANRLAGRKANSFKVAYRPRLQQFTPESNSLSYFLTERYCIWTIRGQTILKAPIIHSHWNLQKADIKIIENKNTPFHFSENPLAHYARFKHTHIHPFETFGKVSK